jgi:alanyl-tRNA synthetase
LEETGLFSEMIRRSFLEFFRQRGHTVIFSSSLIAAGDPTLLFTNAGMNQFKGVFLGTEEREYTRAASSQKCLRVSGKHNDLEAVGMTNRHHTFFEMLGNFSFGDYFKIGAIEYAWEYVTGILDIPAKRLWATVYREDAEAEKIWLERIGIDRRRLWRGGKEDNYWAMGETGPCGPCSEIHYDWGENHICESGCPDPQNCAKFSSQDCPRFIELWNLVFMQFDRDQKGELHPLPKPSVDTGAGLERIAAVMQGVYSNFDTDLFKPIISRAEEVLKVKYSNSDLKPSFCVIADHIRALVFAIADGVVFSNEGRGYVLRRILRRALRHGHQKLKYPEPFIHKLVEQVVRVMGKAYPELREREDYIKKVIAQEEETFCVTVDRGLLLFEEILARARAQGALQIPGKDAFELYSTYGFPIDMTEVMARESGLSVDMSSFEAEMRSHREKSRKMSKFALAQEKSDATAETKFLGYEKLQIDTSVVNADQEKIVLEKTPFYAEAGGQVGDTGKIEGKDFEFTVRAVRRSGTTIFHFGEYSRGKRPEKGQSVTAQVNVAARTATARNHTATHLLQAALREVLGQHIRQSGSYVGPDKLRFDFTHYEPLLEEQIQRVEGLVNEKVLENLPVKAAEKSFREAKEEGAIAIFEEKYGERVRVIDVAGFSKELCGGIHVSHTGEIGLFKIISEGSVQAGIRRIEALTGLGSFQYVTRVSQTLSEIARTLQVEEGWLLTRARELLEKEKELSQIREAQQAKQEGTMIDEVVAELWKEANKKPEGLRLLRYALADVSEINVARGAWDRMREKFAQTAVFFELPGKDSAQIVIAFSKDLTKKGFDAGKLAKELGSIIGGSGGGRRELGQAGGNKPSELPRAWKRFETYCREALK